MAGVAGRSGRRPKPVAKKQLAGNPGKRKLNTDEPDFSLISDIDCPIWMGEYGRQLWETIVPELCKEKVLAATDVQNLEIYCSAYDQFREAQDHIARHGIVIPGAQGSPVKNPAVTAKNEAVRQMATYGGMLGLDPSSRQRLMGPKKEGDGNPFAALLNG
ncbi:phage terminase small subunit P27 family [bacterium SGD-2]|nr:phage terminase small subunit P27 family [bacterium SGD-2]